MFGNSRSRSSTERTAEERQRAREERERRRAGGTPPAAQAQPGTPTEPELAGPAQSPPDRAGQDVADTEPAALELAALDVAGTSHDDERNPADEGATQELAAPLDMVVGPDPDVAVEPGHDVAGEPEPEDLIWEEPARTSASATHSEHVDAEGHEEVDAQGPDVESPALARTEAALDPAAPVLGSARESGQTARRSERIPPPPSIADLRPSKRRRGRGRGRDSLLERRASRIREHRATAKPGRGRLTRARVAALLALLAAVFVVWFLLSLLQPGAGSGSGRVIVRIPKGASAGKIGSILDREGVVSSGFFFDMRALIDGKRGALHSGTFALKHDMSYASAIEALSKPPPTVIAVKVVIPEGETRSQIAEIARADGLTGSYLTASKRSAALDPTRYGAPRSTPNLEGFLFPATYELRAGIPAQRLVEQQLLAFRRRFDATEIQRAQALHETPYELLTVASMIEREAEVERDRPRIAAVIYNRLRLGMALGIDATIRYALGDYSKPLTASQLRTPSAYNTRLRKGLPPTPIGNPGMASIEAAEHPAHVPYLYYVAAADGCGEHVFSTSYAQFEKDAAAYREAVAKNGGRVPSCKRK